MIDIDYYEFDIRDKCIESCLSLFRDIANLNDIAFEKIVGKSEIYYTANVAYKNHIINIYIYVDGAEFIIDDDFNPIFEWYEGVSEDSLIESFIQALKKAMEDIMSEK